MGGVDRVKLSSLNARSGSGKSVDQPLHADSAAIHDEHGGWVCNALWMVTPYTKTNGPLRTIPGSHLFRRLPQDVLEDPSAPHPDQVLVTGSPGTVVVLDAHTWHSGLASTANETRTSIHAF